MATMKERKVFILVERSQVLKQAEIGKLIFLLTRKRSGKYKSRLVLMDVNNDLKSGTTTLVLH